MHERIITDDKAEIQIESVVTCTALLFSNVYHVSKAVRKCKEAASCYFRASSGTRNFVASFKSFKWLKRETQTSKFKSQIELLRILPAVTPFCKEPS